MSDAPDLARLPSMTALLDAASRHAELSTLPRTALTDALRAAVEATRVAMTQRHADAPDGATGATGVLPASVGRGADASDRADTTSGLPASPPLTSPFDVKGAGREEEHNSTTISNASTYDLDAILQRAADLARATRSGRLRRVINATGIVLHTGLGRSVLADAAVERLTRVAAGYCSLEIDLITGERGRRGGYAEQLLCRLTGADAAMVVNNNAAATMLVLRALAAGKEVIVSRGQLVEIGGSFRLPDVMAAGGATLREVGTTNKTHLRDYESAIGPKTGLIMHVHTSNYRIVGFSESPGAAELVALAHARGLPMLDDLGSGALQDDDLWSAAGEPTVAASLRTGADVVAFSGDKLLGGPQAGILLGGKDFIDRLRRDPMARAVRVDKLAIAALEATLELYLDPKTVAQRVPTLARLSEPIESLAQRAESLATLLRKSRPNDGFEVAQEESFAGGGSLPAWPLPTAVIRWKPRGESVSAVAERLRMGDPAVLVRIRDDAILLDVRTIEEREYGNLASALK